MHHIHQKKHHNKFGKNGFLTQIFLEIYKDKLIFYSLGNFIFDQFFSENVRTGLCIKMKLYEKELYYQLIPFRNVNFMITLMPESDKAVLIKSIFDRSILDQENRQSFLKNGLIKMNINN